MAFSLNEIESMSKRAARGAGLSWGLAEETGKAVRWLSAHGFPGPKELAELLTRNDGKHYESLVPESLDGVWRSRSGRLCPLIAGAALCDRASEIAAGRDIELGPTAQPLLLAPFAAGAAEMSGTAIQLSWAGIVLVFPPKGVLIKGERVAMIASGADSIQCRRAECISGVSPEDTGTSSQDVDVETWNRLNAFAIRIFAPATEASRLAGAGAGSNEND